jgi:Calx-beta domain-containing protein/VCBS repeat protein
MWMKTFFKSLTSTSIRQRPTRRPASRLRLEALEDRCLLSFAPLADYGLSGPPPALAAVDLDGDGLIDLGIGRLQTSIVADLNGDAIDDLVTVNPSYRLDLRVQVGNGDGTYQQTQVIVLPSQLPPGTGFYPVQLPITAALGDLNGDGRLDLVAAGFDEELIDGGLAARQDHYVNVLLGNGDGSFGQSSTYYVTSNTYNESMSRSYAYILGVRDFDGDGRADILTTGDAVRLFAGNGDGTLQSPPSIFQGSWTNDVNADGVLDRVYLEYQVYYSGDSPDYTTRHANVSLGYGDGSFAPAVISDLGTVYGESSGGVSGLADFDGDGFPELVVSEFRIQGSAYSVVAVAHNDGIWTPPPPPPPPPPPSITLSDVTVTEGNTGTRAAVFTVTLSAASSQPVTVAYATANGTAAAGSDYQAASGTLTIPAGQTTGTITVLVNGDRIAEPNETFFVNLSSPTNATIADGQAVGTIQDDEPRISISDVSRYEGRRNHTTLFTFTVTLSAAYDQPVAMSFQTVNGTATTGDNDYVARTGTLTFAPGETTKTITIEIKGDNKQEADEYFYLDLFGNSSNSLFTKNRGIGTILNDD